MIAKETIIQQLKTIYDPEIPVNIYDLGLIYDVQLIGTDAYIVMTLTTATCPAAAFLPEEVKNSLLQIKGLQNAHVDVVYEPKWTTDKMSAEAKQILGFA